MIRYYLGRCFSGLREVLGQDVPRCLLNGAEPSLTGLLLEGFVELVARTAGDP
jgi:hypothetical protein